MLHLDGRPCMVQEHNAAAGNDNAAGQLALLQPAHLHDQILRTRTLGPETALHLSKSCWTLILMDACV